MSGYRRGKQTRIGRFFALISIVVLLGLSVSDTASAITSTPAIKNAQSQLQALSDLVDQLNNQLEAVTEDYDYANQQYEDAKLAADRAATQVEQAQTNLAAARERLCERLVAIYKEGDIGILDALFDSGSFSDVLTLLDGFRWMSYDDDQLVVQIQTYRDQEAQLQAKLDADLKQLEGDKNQADAARQKVLDQVKTQQKALKGKEAELAQLRKAEAAREAKLAAEARAYQAFLKTRPGKVIGLAKSFLGVPYVWGGSSPHGFDCSGLVQYCYAKVGVSLPHSSRMMFNYGTAVAWNNLRPGDLVFFFTPIQHVGIYLGNGLMINATGTHVQISQVWPGSYRGARRVL